ncbi:MAG: prephenate dehydratase [candidate division KSB1 bacterium]|nr:prephenate dehydratase [candidate division KSB1 bacterium]MDZ7336226.1 prephenate dehydratase [candidate division KSB1 bacterium]MDZ7357625.1 prephenate dehydratase [candidate division KSB1 bacterium]MDZ7401562.1 prephenate dehydratase [candidate division KSB1 bacterium]
MSNYEICFQGEHYAFSELAAKKFLGESAVCHPRETFEQVFQSVKAKDPTLGIVPIENTLSGSIHQNYDLLLENSVRIVGEVNLRIELNLIAAPGVSISQLKTVYSHPAAIGQCRNFWKRYPQIEIVPTYDTAGSVKIIAERDLKEAAAIASYQAAKDYGMNILLSEIEDYPENYTRFLIISTEEFHFGEPNKTSIVFATRHIPGALFKSLSVFFLRDLNLLKIESRPLRGKPWQYIFYLDFEGSLAQQSCQNALRHLEEITEFIKVLGSYPAAT